MPRSVDLNADVGEECGDDVGLLHIVTTANVAAGAHAGGGSVLSETVRLAASLGVAVGAHPSYPDRQSFGRISMADRLTLQAVQGIVCEQVLEVAHECARHGVGLSHVKAHGALYNDAAVREDVARAVLAGVRSAAQQLGLDDLPVMGLPGSVLERVVRHADGRYIGEAFADRAYASDGTLVPRSSDDAVLSDPAAVCRQAVEIVSTLSIQARDGSRVDVTADSLCLHGDTPDAVALARAVRAAIEGIGVVVERWTPTL